MAKNAKQQVKELKSYAQENVHNLKNDKISLEKEKRLLVEYKRAIRLFKEIEARSKRGEKHQIELKNFKELQNLNNKIIKTKALEDEEKERRENDKRSISMEMAWAQVDGKVRVLFEEMEALIRPEHKKEFFDILRYNTDLKRDLVGMTEVIKFVQQRDFNRALASMIYFGVENRIQEMETFFNVKFSTELTSRLENVLKIAKEQGLNTFEIKDAASENLNFADGFLNEAKATFVSAFTGENISSFEVAASKDISVVEIRESKKSLKKEEAKLKEQFYFENNPQKQLEIKIELLKLKTKKKELEAKSLERQGKFLAKAIEEKRKNKEIKTDEIKQKIKTYSSYGKVENSEENNTSEVPNAAKNDLDKQIDKLEKEIRSAYNQSEFKELIEKISRGETDAGTLAALEKLKAKLGSEYIKSFQNKKSIDDYREDMAKFDDSKKESRKTKAHIVNVILEIIHEKLSKHGFNVSEEELNSFETTLNTVESSYVNSNIKGCITPEKVRGLIEKKKLKYAEKHKGLIKTNESFDNVQINKDNDNILEKFKAYYDNINKLTDQNLANYTDEEITALESGFNSCESIIVEKNLKGDAELNQARENARKKVFEMRERHKLFEIFDPSELYSIKDKNQQLAKLKDNLKYLCSLIKTDSIDRHNLNQISRLIVEYRKLKALLMTSEDTLQDVDLMLQEVDEWGYKTVIENSNEKMIKFKISLFAAIDESKKILKHAIDLLKKPDLSDNEIALIISCKFSVKNLKKNYTVSSKFFKEIDELYNQVDPFIERYNGECYTKQAEDLLQNMQGIENNFNKKTYENAKKSFEELNGKYAKYISSKLLIKLVILMKKCEAKNCEYEAKKAEQKKNELYTNEDAQVKTIQKVFPGSNGVAGIVDSDKLTDEAQKGIKIASDEIEKLAIKPVEQFSK